MNKALQGILLAAAMLMAPMAHAQDAPTCETTYTDTVKAVSDAKLTAESYEGVRFGALQAAMEAELGKFPALIDTIIIIHSPDGETVNVGFFFDGCLVHAVPGVPADLMQHFVDSAFGNEANKV